ncbi:Serine carboxypeptidase-like 31 [Hibiscus syriacus]|uniref:Carboxypeptidase n=1 Tax=Hibiscus syriacus TaxID=106335 RepID=A0A6A2Z2X0_HIBSY|nr:Serine carboxypeptidase-like 31 [Hibiscus syriacus]
MTIFVVLFTLVFISTISSSDRVAGERHWRWLDEKGSSSLGNHDDLVTDLPGQPPVDFRHYAGYVTVNEINGRTLFYWFYEAMSQPDEKPLVLWLNGGNNNALSPNSSNLYLSSLNTFVIEFESRVFFCGIWSHARDGPFIVDTNGRGINFKTSHGIKWFLKFPSYRKRTFYIAGESYAGKYVPELAELIYDNKKDPSLYIELDGILLGNPETYDAEDWRGMVDYAWSHAVVSDETHKTITETCDFKSNDTWSNEDCSEAVDEVLKQYKEIDIFSLYTPMCIGDTTSSDEKLLLEVTMKRKSNMVIIFCNLHSPLCPYYDMVALWIFPPYQMPRILGGFDPCLDGYANTFYNRLDVQKALHVSDGHNLRNWASANTKPSVLPIHQKLIAAGIRIWVYSGDTNGRVPVLSTRYSISALGLPITKAWRPWYHEKQVSGWIQEYEGLKFATFRGAGHAVPCFKPSSSLAFFSAFLHGESPSSSRY